MAEDLAAVKSNMEAALAVAEVKRGQKRILEAVAVVVLASQGARGLAAPAAIGVKEKRVVLAETAEEAARNPAVTILGAVTGGDKIIHAEKSNLARVAVAAAVIRKRAAETTKVLEGAKGVKLGAVPDPAGNSRKMIGARAGPEGVAVLKAKGNPKAATGPKVIAGHVVLKVIGGRKRNTAELLPLGKVNPHEDSRRIPGEVEGVVETAHAGKPVAGKLVRKAERLPHVRRAERALLPLNEVSIKMEAEPCRVPRAK